MTEELKTNAEQPLLEADPSPPLITRFRVMPLCFLVLLFVFQLILLLGQFQSERLKSLSVATFCFEIIVVALVFAFNRLQVNLHENDTIKTSWALKYLWEIKCNVLIYFGLFFDRVSREWERQKNEIATDCSGDVDGIVEIRRPTLFTLPIIVLFLILLFLLYLGFVAHRYSIALSKNNEQQQMCMTQKMFIGLQIAVKLCFLATVSFPNLQSVADVTQTFGVILLLFAISYLTCWSSVKNLLWTPLPMMFDSTKMQFQLVNETLQLYTGMGIVVLVGQTLGMYLTLSKSHSSHWEFAGLGLIYVRIVQVLVFGLMGTMAVKINKSNVISRYLIADICFSMINLSMVTSLVLFWFKSLHIETRFLFGPIALYVWIKIGLFASSTLRHLIWNQELDDETKKWQNDLWYLCGYLLLFVGGVFAYDKMYERPRTESSVEFGMALFWLVSLLSGAASYYYYYYSFSSYVSSSSSSLPREQAEESNNNDVAKGVIV